MSETHLTNADVQSVANILNHLFHFPKAIPRDVPFETQEDSDDGRDWYDIHPVFFAQNGKLTCKKEYVFSNDQSKMAFVKDLLGIDLQTAIRQIPSTIIGKTKHDETITRWRPTVDAVIPIDHLSIDQFKQRAIELVIKNKANSLANDLRWRIEDEGAGKARNAAFEGEVAGRAVQAYTESMSDAQRLEFLQAMNQQLAPKAASIIERRQRPAEGREA